MKILIVSKCPTHPTNAGNRRFILNQINLLEKMGHEVHFLFVEENGLRVRIKDNAADEMKTFFKEKFHHYQVDKIQKTVFNIRQRIRAIFAKGRMKCDDYYPFFLTKVVKKLK
ncbi:MAG: hypothetical protein HUJ68_05365, partial [Clostridia bacterium]|nr:hypothetical protein [Clostridia bacterium]